MPLQGYIPVMPQQQGECDRKLERWTGPFIEAGIGLAALAVVRGSEVNAREAAENIADFTAGFMQVDEAKIAPELDELVKKGYAEQHDGRYRITALGKRHMYQMLKQWNRYVDSMNNLWGCYYGT
jgi:DNA-binding PadR family transcriptional regulator